MSESARDASVRFLVHARDDHVGVAVTDIEPGRAPGAVLATDHDVEVHVTERVPLGHKVALVDIGAGEDVIEYGVRIGVSSQDISRGSYVHTHNLRSARWQTSIAH